MRSFDLIGDFLAPPTGRLPVRSFLDLRSLGVGGSEGGMLEPVSTIILKELFFIGKHH